jgi:hypothetical protein
LSPVDLLPLDRALQRQPVFYGRDDWVIVAYSRWRLRRAIRAMHQALDRLGFKLHPDKTQIGRVEQGFDFLGYRLTPNTVYKGG